LRGGRATGFVSTLVPPGLESPDGVAVDGSGDVCIADAPRPGAAARRAAKPSRPPA